MKKNLSILMLILILTSCNKTSVIHSNASEDITSDIMISDTSSTTSEEKSDSQIEVKDLSYWISKLKGDVRLTGSCIRKYTEIKGQEEDRITTAFSEDKFYSLEEYLGDDGIWYKNFEYRYINVDDIVYQERLNIQNEVIRSLPLDGNGVESEYSFSDFINPFSSLDEKDYLVEGSSFSIEDQEVVRKISHVLSGYDEEIDAFSFTFDDEKLALTVVSKEIDAYTPYIATYTYDIEVDSNEAYTLNPYLLNDETRRLKSALSELNKKNTYTMIHKGKPDNVDEVYNIRVTKDAFGMYKNDKLVSGVAKYKDGNYYEYINNSNTITKGKKIEDYESNLYKYEPDFTSFAPEIFTYIGEDTFTIDDYDLYSEVIYRIADDFDFKERARLFSKPFYIKLDGESIHSVSFKMTYFDMWDVDDITYTFEDIGSTVIAASFN